MREQGKVVKVNGKRATVKVDKKDECSKCGMCLFPKGASSIEFDAENSLGALEKDLVIIESQKEGRLLGAILAFLIPLILIGVALLLNYLVLFNELITLGMAIGLIALWYVALAFIDKRLKKTVNYSTRIIKIISADNNQEKI